MRPSTTTEGDQEPIDTPTQAKGNPVQPTKATKKPKTHSLKQRQLIATDDQEKQDTLTQATGNPVQPTKATKKPRDTPTQAKGNPVQPTKATKKPRDTLTQKRRRPSTTTKGDRETIDSLTQAKDESKMNPLTLSQQRHYLPTVYENTAGDEMT